MSFPARKSSGMIGPRPRGSPGAALCVEHHVDDKALLAAIWEHPHDDTVRLAFADWLQETGDPVKWRGPSSSVFKSGMRST